MMRRSEVNERRLNIHKQNFSNHNILSRNISKISIDYNNTTLSEGQVEIFEVEDNNKEEEDLVDEEAKSYVIIVDNQDTLLDIVQVM